MHNLFSVILSFATLGCILSAEDNALPDKIFQAHAERILATPVMELGGYVFFSGRARPASQSAQSQTIAQAMARTMAEGNVWLLKGRQISYEGTILAERPALQVIVFNNWRALGHEANYTIRNSVVVFSGIKDGIFRYVAAVKPDDIVYHDTEPLTFEKIRHDILKDVNRRHELVAYELLDESEIEAHRAEIAAGLEKKVNRNFARMFLEQEPNAPLPKGIEFARKNLASLGEDATLDELLKLTSNLPYDRELCQRLEKAFRDREMLRCAAWMNHLLVDYEELKRSWEKVEETTPAPEPTSSVEEATPAPVAAAPGPEPVSASVEEKSASVQSSKDNTSVLSEENQAVVDQIQNPVPETLPTKENEDAVQKTKEDPKVPAQPPKKRPDDLIKYFK